MTISRTFWTARSIKLVLVILVIAGVGSGGLFLAPRGAGGHQARAAEQQPVPVLATSAKTDGVPIIARGLGSAQAYNTVTVKSRVDGDIVKAA